MPASRWPGTEQHISYSPVSVVPLGVVAIVYAVTIVCAVGVGRQVGVVARVVGGAGVTVRRGVLAWAPGHVSHITSIGS